MQWKNLELLARVETWDNGKPIRETSGCRFAIGHRSFQVFCRRYPCRRGSGFRTRQQHIVADCSRTPWRCRTNHTLEFSAVDGSLENSTSSGSRQLWYCKPAEQTPVGIMVLAEIIEDILPAGVLNIVNGFGWKQANH